MVSIFFFVLLCNNKINFGLIFRNVSSCIRDIM
jgi:hypothetical protein